MHIWTATKNTFISNYMSTQKWVQFSSVQSLSRVRLCDSMNCSTPGLHQSPTPRVHSNSCPSSLWCHPAISSSVIPFSSCPQSLPASDSFPMTGVSSLASFLPKNTQGWSPLFNLFFFYFLIKILFLLYFTLQYCIGFAIHWHESTTSVHELPILNTTLTSHTISSLWIIPVHHPQASYILYRT